jgi:hypothetical protein
MEIIKRKILLEDSTDRTFNSPNWGVLTATSFYINVLITQNIDDMGLFTDIDYIDTSELTYTIPDYQVLIDKLNISGYTFPFMSGIVPGVLTGITGTTEVILRLTGSVESNYYEFGNSIITGSTDSKIQDLRSYNMLNPYLIGFDISQEGYVNYNNVSVSGHSRILSLGEPSVYVFDAITGATIGTPLQPYGLLYKDYTGFTRQVIVGNDTISLPLTNIQYIGEGWNETNISLSALTKEEYLFGITAKPDIQSDVFVDRGETTVLQRHLILSEIRSLDQLARYGNGFYKLTKQ